MILPILAYGSLVLRKKGVEISKNYPNLNELIDNMWETMNGAYGVGIAAPQIGVPIRLFVIDASPFADSEGVSKEDAQVLKNFKRTFINPKIIKEKGEEWMFNEGCLSIPDVREDVFRKQTVTIEYYNQNWEKQTETLSGLPARIVQHEYDHIEGILFTDLLSPLKKRLIKGKLTNIAKGKVNTDYKMRFPQAKKRR